jgi:hypothetical protein
VKLFSLALATLAVLVSPACGSVSSERSGESGSAPLPDIAQVICEPSQTRLLTPTVRPQADGVHLSVENNSTREIAFVVDDPGSGGGGFDVPGGAVMDLYSGRVRVACYDPYRDDPSEMAGEELEIIDENGIWVSPALGPSCKTASTGIADSVAEGGEPGDTIALARGLFAGQGLRQNDVVEPAGYPEQTPRIVRVVRDGETIATVAYRSDGAGGWIQDEVTVCTEPTSLDFGP